jgi:zinc transport system permease protein
VSEIYESIRQIIIGMAQAGTLPRSFEYAFVINAMICALFIGPITGAVGTMVVVKRLAFFSQAVGQAALTGVAIGIVLGEPVDAPYVSMFGFCILFALTMNYTMNRTRISSETVIAVFLSVSLAAGASLLLFVTSKVNVHILDNVLFGSILTVNDRDINVLIITSILIPIVGGVIYNRSLIASFNSSLAHARGISVRLLDYVFMVLVTILTVASVKVVGAVLVEALLVIPAATARIVSWSMKSFVLISVAISTIACVFGVIAPMELDIPIPSGGAIILCAAVFFAVATIAQMTFSRMKDETA